MLLVAVIAPNLHFAVAIASNAGAAQASLWIVYVLYAGFAWLPAVRRVSERASFVVLLGVGFVVVLCYGFDSSLKQALARAAGMFGAPALWDGVPFIDDTQEFIHPYAGYRLRVPRTWQFSQGPMTGASQFTLQRDGTAAAILRPSCDLDETPLSVVVRQLEEQWPELRRSCSHWRSLEACLLQRGTTDPKQAEWWEWIARRPGAMRSVRLGFLVYDARAARDIYAIIGSVEPAPGDGQGPGCPVPLEWATPF